MCHNGEAKMENEKTQVSCPKCGKENRDDAQSCSSCGCSLMQAAVTGDGPDVKISTFGVASCVLGILSIILLLVTLLLNWNVLAIGHLVMAISAVLFGIVGLVCIGQSRGRQAGRGFAVTGIAIPVVVFALTVMIVSVRRPRSTGFRMVCGTNLAGIGKAMLIYSHDYDNELPRSGGRNANWAQRIPNWMGVSRIQAYGVSSSGQGGVGTISSCFYLLVKYAEVKPKSFLCAKSEPKAKPFVPSKHGARGRDLIDLWDFGLEPWKHCSYSYHMPFGQHTLTTSSDPGMAVAGDRNPWIDSPFVKYRKDFSKFDPDGDREAVKAGNTIGAHGYGHHADGQNVLFLDSHVAFEKTSSCGVNDDNIYTCWDGQDIRRGATPVLGSESRDGLDSLLVHDPPPTNVK